MSTKSASRQKSKLPLPSSACSREAANVGRSSSAHSLGLVTHKPEGTCLSEQTATLAQAGFARFQWRVGHTASRRSGRHQVEQQPDPPAAVGSRATTRGLLTHAFSAAEPQLRRNIDVSLCVLAPQAVVDPTLAQVSKKPRNQIKSGTSERCFIAELWHHPSQSKLKIKPFMSAYLSAWEMRLTQCTVHSAMRSGPRSPPLPVPRQRSTITFPQRRMACGAASASAGMPSLSDHRPFRAAPREASTRFQGMEARKDNNA